MIGLGLFRQPNKRFLIGLAILIAGTGPLLGYILLGPADGNPIGLGLWFFFTFPFALGFLIAGTVGMWRARAGREYGPQGRSHTGARPQAKPTARKNAGESGGKNDLNWPPV